MMAGMMDDPTMMLQMFREMHGFDQGPGSAPNAPAPE